MRQINECDLTLARDRAGTLLAIAGDTGVARSLTQPVPHRREAGRWFSSRLPAFLSVGAFVLSLSLELLCASAWAAPVPGGYDGKWWLSIAETEQYGFVNGFPECYVFEYGGKFDAVLGDFGGTKQRVTDYYRTHPADVGLRVAEVIARLRPPEPPRNGRRAQGAKSQLRGLFWRQEFATGGRAGELGFVEGYLECLAHFLPEKRATFRQVPADYVAAITAWYRFDEQTGDVDAEREKIEIRKVLEIVRANAGN